MADCFNCPHCGNEIATRFLKTGEMALCRNCGKHCPVPEDRKPCSSPEKVALNKSSSVSIEPKTTDLSSQLLLASQGQRFGNYLLDTLFIFVLSFVFGIIAALLGLSGIWSKMNNYVIGAILVIIYYVPQEASSGRTLGKLITRTKVVNEDGSEISFGQALGRTLSRSIPFEPFSFLGGRGRPRGWHDKLSNTAVISVK